MKVPVALVLATLLVLPGCASRASDSETEWDRAQCNQIIDRTAREKCLERLGIEEKPERARRR
jgi:hypothetical protein